MPLQAGSSSNPGDIHTMAGAIQTAFLQEWTHFMGEDMPVPEANAQMQLLFVAIAKGVVSHLHANPGAFKVQVELSAGSGEVSDIEIG